MANRINSGIFQLLLNMSKSRSSRIRLLYPGINRNTMTTAIIIAKMLRKTDSVRNWVISRDREEPTTFRRPTSRARVVERAVARFIKLILAIIRINRAMAENADACIVLWDGKSKGTKNMIGLARKNNLALHICQIEL